MSLDEVGNVGRHLLNLSVVELFKFTEGTDVLLGDKVDGNTLATETSTTSDSVNVVLQVAGQVIVDNEGHLLDIDTTSEQVSGDQNSAGTGSELV